MSAGFPNEFPLLINRAAGSVGETQPTVTAVRRAFSEHGRTAFCEMVSPATLSQRVRGLAQEHWPVIAVAGGDGTISAAANVLAGRDIALAVLPLGTRNHFARDLGLPLELKAAVAALVNGGVRRIDVGEVNRALFVNNASVGLYTRAVRWRDKLLEQRPVGKTVVMMYVLAAMLWRLPRYRLWLESDGEMSDSLCVPFVFVGNNQYGGRLLSLASRERLDDGCLHLAYPARSRLGALLHLILGVLMHPLIRLPQLMTQDIETVQLRGRRQKITVALDGELRLLRQPLSFRIRRKALAVIIPQSL